MTRAELEQLSAIERRVDAIAFALMTDTDLPAIPDVTMTTLRVVAA